MTDRLAPRKENNLSFADIVGGKLVLKRYDGSTLTSDTAMFMLSSLDPNALPAGTPTMVTVIGSGFLAEATCTVGGEEMPTEYVSDTELHVTVSGPWYAGMSVPVRVKNSVGKWSNELTLQVQAVTGRPPPALTSMVPDSAIGGTNIEADFIGTGIEPSATLWANGARAYGAFVTPELYRMSLSTMPPSGSINYVLSNNSLGEDPSNALSLIVNNFSTVSLTSVAPNTVVAGVSTMITLTGVNFAPGLYLTFSGLGISYAQAPSFVSDTTLTFTYTWPSAGVGTVCVSTATGAQGNTLPFTVT